MSDIIWVNASSAPGHQDCPRNWAASNLPNFVRGGGDGERVYQIGALIGDSCHKGAELMLCQKYETGDWNVIEAVDFATKVFLDVFKKSKVTFDDVTSSQGYATIQIESQLQEFARGFMPEAQPSYVEQSFRYRHSDRLRVKAKIDLIEHDVEANTARIVDYKFGRHVAPYHAQMGLYKRALEQAKWFTGEVVELLMVYVPRSRCRKTGWKQAPLKKVSVPLLAAERAGLKQCDEIERSANAYAATGDIWEFNANPRSKRCNAKGCRAWGTERCDQWTTEGDEDGDNDD